MLKEIFKTILRALLWSKGIFKWFLGHLNPGYSGYLENVP